MISFVIPALNEEKVIGNLLAELKSYSGVHEVIVSDDGSTDRTVEIASMIADRVIPHPKDKPHRIAGARNAGAALARGEYLVFIDSDMHIKDPNAFFEEALSCFEKDGALVGLTVSIAVRKELRSLMDHIIYFFINAIFYFQNNVFQIGAASGEFQMVRSEVFKKVNGFNEELVAGEDNEFFSRIRKLGKTRMKWSLMAYNDGRRAHKIGWPRLLVAWVLNFTSVALFKKSLAKKWEQIR